MFVTIINDCRDANAFGRQATRIGNLLSCPVSTVGVANDVEASGMLIDILDASTEKENVILVNVAPREKTKNKWENGTPFGYFYVGNTLVCASIGGETLRLVYELGLIQTINVFDIPTVVQSAESQGLLTANQAEHITHTQFRSFEFLPRIAAWLIEGYSFPTEKLKLQSIFSEGKPRVWWIDCFGNCKTTLIAATNQKTVQTVFGELPFITRLTDVPDMTLACVKGSSGFDNQRFVEIVVQGSSAAEKLSLTSGKEV